MSVDAGQIKENLLGRGWLADLDPASRQAILGAGRLIPIGKGKILFGLQDSPGGIFGVVSGGIALSTRGLDGLPVPGHIMRAGHWFGHGSVQAPQARSLLAQANEASTVMHLPLTAIRRLREASPGLAQAFLRLPGYAEAILLAIVADLLIASSDRRLAAVLLRITDAVASPGPVAAQGVPLTQELLGQLANVSRQTVARFVRRATGEGVIAWQYGQVRILDIDGLQAFAARAAAP